MSLRHLAGNGKGNLPGLAQNADLRYTWRMFSKDPHPIKLRVAFVFLALTALFALAYTQSPLYTSNQNQYFLQAQARLGLGYLNEDWLANTLDPTPGFSLLAEWTYRLLRWDGVFYLYYALLMGVYLFSLLGIVGQVWQLSGVLDRSSLTTTLAFLAALFVVHSAGLRFALSRFLGVNWTYVLEDGVADQRLLGPVFQPSTFGVLLLLSIYLFLKRKPVWAALCAALCATMHPTYLLSAAALTLVYMLVGWLDAGATHEEHVHRSGEAGVLHLNGWEVLRALLPGVVALLAVLPILVYAYALFGSTPPETTAQARHILVDYRIPHHARLDWWLDATAVVKIALVCLALYLARRSRLFLVMALPFGVAVGLTALQALTHSDMLALLFPWRLSTWLAPLSTALILGWLVTGLVARLESRLPRLGALVRFFSLAAIVLAVLAGLVRMQLDFARQLATEEQPVMAFVAAHHAVGEIYLIPIKMQEFRLSSGSPAYVDFKAIPYLDAEVLEWYRRVQQATQFYKQADCSLLPQFAQEGVTHVVLPLDEFPSPCPQLRQLYRDEHYGLYDLMFAGVR